MIDYNQDELPLTLYRALKPIDVVDKCRIPAIFAHGAEDTLIPPHHSVDLYEKYPGMKDLLVFPGGHNSVRPPRCRICSNFTLCSHF